MRRCWKKKLVNLEEEEGWEDEKWKDGKSIFPPSLQSDLLDSLQVKFLKWQFFYCDTKWCHKINYDASQLLKIVFCSIVIVKLYLRNIYLHNLF